MQYLVDSVEGPAALRVKGLPLTGASFDLAWQKLMRRYDNPTRRMHTYMELLIDMKPVKRKSSGELIELLDKAEAALKTFKDLSQIFWKLVRPHLIRMQSPTKQSSQKAYVRVLISFKRVQGSKNRCANCKGRHHTKIHSDRRQGGEAADSSNSTGQKGSSSAPGKSSMLEVSASTTVVGRTRLMATAKILLQSVDGNLMYARCLIDPCAEVSFVMQRVVQCLSAKIKPVSVSVVGVGAGPSAVSKGEVFLQLKSRLNTEFCLEFSALVLREVTGFLPREEVVVSNWDHILQLADPDFACSKQIDCVLSAEVYAAIIRPGLRVGATDTPVAQETVFGWILTGRASSAPESDTAQSAQACHVDVEPSILTLLERFWEMEEISTSKVLSEEDQYCEDYFADTVYRDSKGRFVVRLPFPEKLSEVSFAHTRQIAVGCLLRSEKRRAQDSRVDSDYRKFMEEYLTLGHMEPVNSSHRKDNTFYFTHHPVYSAESDVTIIISMWRFAKIVFTADIVKEFRQILIHPDDVDWQRIVWRSDVSKPIEEYRLLTVTYGTRSAPYLSIRTLLQLASEGNVEFPLAAQVLRHNMYVDDAFVGADNESVAIEIRNQLIKLLSSAGMELGKWASNSSAIVEDIQAEKQKEFAVE
ncbi:uncharacterized protein LOC116417364 [Nasonia vitripennis]|uniref:Peptidase aspartic putative domain-containing protein n=1 Tax=Nasonia vitripennis TaxID=7425 RepID=A0A7M7QFV5_NASVI|nr:uncharacterized protein LOC116417364 [Nasonia vitripennis]